MELMPDSRIPEGTDVVADLLTLANQGHIEGLKKFGMEKIIRAVISLRSEEKYSGILWPAETNELTGNLHDAVYMANVSGEKNDLERHPWTLSLLRFFRTLGFSPEDIDAHVAAMKLDSSIKNAFRTASRREAGDEQW